MITINGKQILGIQLGDRSIRVSEHLPINSNASQSDRTQRARFASFPFPLETSLSAAEVLGKEFKQFLLQQGFTATRAVMGVPARWLIVTPYSMPPADPQTAADILRLHVTEQFASKLGPMVFDYAGESHIGRSAHLLIVGLRQQVLSHIQTFAAAAGLKPLAVTASGLESAGTAATRVRDGVVLTLDNEGVEFSRLSHGETRSLRRIGSLTSMKPLMAELRRASVAVPTPINPADRVPPSANISSGSLVLFNSADYDRATLNSCATAVGMPVMQPISQWADVPSTDLSDYGPAVSTFALTRRSRSSQRTTVDFLHPRLVKSRDRFKRKTICLSAAGAAVCLLVLIALLDLAYLSHQVSKSDAQFQSMAADLARARPFVESVQFAESFHSPHPRYLACLRDLTADIAPETPVTFTNFSLKTDMHGDLSGRAPAEQNILSLMDRLTTSGRFAELKCSLDAHQLKTAANEVSFNVTFTYVPRL